MPKGKNSISIRGTLEPLSAWKRHKALQELARFMGQEGSCLLYTSDAADE